MKKIGVLLSGCGFKDGSEIHETVAALLAIDQAGLESVCIAPSFEAEEVDHLTFKPTGQKRNILRESARIARGNIREITSVRAGDLDALILPGGSGAAKNLSNLASRGAEALVHPEVERLVKEMISAKKPLGAICIAPALLAVILGSSLHPQLTIGDDSATAQLLSDCGAIHGFCPVDGVLVDAEHKIVSTPAYMYPARISEVFEGIKKLVDEIVQLMGK